MGGVELSRTAEPKSKVLKEELDRKESRQKKAPKPRAPSKRGRTAAKEPKKPVKRKSATLPPRLAMGDVGQRTIKLIALEDSVSECPVKKALIATKTPFKEVHYDKFKVCC